MKTEYIDKSDTSVCKEARQTKLFGLFLVTLALTARCNIRCAHCFGGYGPDRTEKISLGLCKETVRKFRDLGYKTLWITGGEPFLYAEDVFELVSFATAIGLNTVVGTNGFWGENISKCRQMVAKLKNAGLCYLSVSTDRFHQEFVPLSHVKNVVESSRAAGIPCQIAVVKAANDNIADEVEKTFHKMGFKVASQSLKPFGRSTTAPHGMVPDNSYDCSKSCLGAFIINVEANGRVFGCCGPSEIFPDSHPLWLGSILFDDLATTITQMNEDPLLHALRILGPRNLIKLITPESAIPHTSSATKKTKCEECASLFADKQFSDEVRSKLRKKDISKRIAYIEMVLHTKFTMNLQNGKNRPISQWFNLFPAYDYLSKAG